MDERSGPKSGKKNCVWYFFMYFTESTAKVFVWIFQMPVVMKCRTEDSYLFWVLSTIRNTEKLHWIAELHHSQENFGEEEWGFEVWEVLPFLSAKVQEDIETNKNEGKSFSNFPLFKCSHTWFHFSELVGQFIQQWFEENILVTATFLKQKSQQYWKTIIWILKYFC